MGSSSSRVVVNTNNNGCVDENNDQSSVTRPKRDPNSDTDTVPSVLDMTVSNIKRHNVGFKSVGSVVFMPSGHVVLACRDDGLILLDKKFKQLSQLSLDSERACKVSDTEVLVSKCYKKQIQFVEVLPEKMVAKNVLTMNELCRGVCYQKGKIYVVSWDDPDKGEVRVVNKEGKLVRILGLHDWTTAGCPNKSYLFSKPIDVKVKNDGDKVFVTDIGPHTLTYMDQTGRVIYQYKDRYLENPAGILVDRHDNVLVTGCGSHNVHVINKAGTKNKIVLTERDGLNYPRCIAYRHDDGLLAIGMRSDDGKGALMTMKTSLA